MEITEVTPILRYFAEHVPGFTNFKSLGLQKISVSKPKQGLGYSINKGGLE